MSAPTVDIVHSINQVPGADWDDLCGSQSFVNHRWQRLAEACLRDAEPRYLLVHRAGRLEAAAVCALGRRFRHETLQGRLGWVLRLVPLLRCTVPLSSRPGIMVAPQSTAAAVVPALVNGLRRLALRERALCVMYGHFAPDDPTWPNLQASGFQQHGQLAEMTLPIVWSSAWEYATRLPSSDRRKIGKLERRAEREGVQVTRLSSPLDHAGRLRRLIGEVLAHHGSSDIYVADLLEQAAAICGQDLHVLAAWREGEIIGCVVALRDGEGLIAKWIGLDYARSWGTAAYRLLILETIHLAIELGAKHLALGPTAGDTKQDFGAVPNERFSALAVMAPVPAALVGAAAQLVAGRAAIDPTYSSATAASSPALPG